MEDAGEIMKGQTGEVQRLHSHSGKSGKLVCRDLANGLIKFVTLQDYKTLLVYIITVLENGFYWLFLQVFGSDMLPGRNNPDRFIDLIVIR
jgi:hypothetical protein